MATNPYQSPEADCGLPPRWPNTPGVILGRVFIASTWLGLVVVVLVILVAAYRLQ